MRLHRLCVTAFEPFAATEEVDFDALDEAGLFLMHGETGAGKTAILDAVSFALFGHVPGVRDAAPRLRSDHSLPADRTEVLLEATLAGRRMRITRSPKQERPKVRGTGTTDEPARVMLEVCGEDGRWTVLADRSDAVELELAPMLGLSHQQFCQVVLLPQGAFARFLHASSDEREKVLQQLFATERYSAAEVWLADQRRAADADVHSGLDAVGDIASRAAQVDGEEPPPEWRDQPETLADWLERRIVLVEAAEATAQGSRDAAGQARQAADLRNAAVTTLAERQRRHATALAAIETQEAGRQGREDAEQEVQAARRAAPVASLAKRVTAAREASTGAHHTARAAVAKAIGNSAIEADSVGATEARDRAASLRQQAGGAQAVLDIEQRLAEGEARVSAVEADIASAQQAAASHAGWLAGAADERARLNALDEAARAAEARRPGVDAAAADARRRASAATRRDELAALRDDAVAQTRAATGAELEAKRVWLDARELRLSGIAAELAGELCQGEPCRVCGATEHPDPASHEEGQVIDAAAEQAFQEAHEAASKAHMEARSREAALEQEWAAEHALAGDRSAAKLLAASGKAAEAAAEATVLAAGRGAVEEALATHDGQTREHEQERAAAVERMAALRAERTNRDEGLQEARKQVHAARGGFDSIIAHLDWLEAQACDWDAAADALDDAGAVERELERCTAAAESEAQLQEFESLSDAVAAGRSAELVARIVEGIEQFDAELAKLRSVADDPELLAAAREPTPDAELAAAALAEAEVDLEDAQTAYGLAVERGRALRALARDLAERLEELEPLLERQRLVRRVAGLVDGSSVSNRLKMPLAAYVLTARLEQIAEAASSRLEKMSAGRYVLAHCDERVGRSRKAGLGLQVLDGWTGRERPPSSLSGGETFQASLALALGLADVVTAESGGARLETLFVDEGFGSLGDRALDDVLDVLDALREGGRAVGVISHVAEMRQRIPAQLHVAKGRRGSQIVQS